MQKLIAVEEAKTLMNEAKEWSVWHWLTEKKRVRETADKATAALDEAEKKVKAGWSDVLKKAYRKASTDGALDGKTRAALERVREADEAAKAALQDAEDTFAEADKRMSVPLAREGAQKAIDAYELHEKAIRRAEAVMRL
jgi:type I restriction-modification system DNA methylase subunit